MNGESSEWLEVTSGVPQGSVLEPLLFILYVNDIVEFLQCNLETFADDIKLYSVTETIHDIDKFQQDLDSLQDWYRLLLLILNLRLCMLAKCHTLTITHLIQLHLGVLQIYLK